MTVLPCLASPPAGEATHRAGQPARPPWSRTQKLTLPVSLAIQCLPLRLQRSSRPVRPHRFPPHANVGTITTHRLKRSEDHEQARGNGGGESQPDQQRASICGLRGWQSDLAWVLCEFHQLRGLEGEVGRKGKREGGREMYQWANGKKCMERRLDMRGLDQWIQQTESRL